MTKAFEADVPATVRALFRSGDPKSVGKVVSSARIRAMGDWFGAAGRAPDLPRDERFFDEEDEQVYAQALAHNGFFGPDSWYMDGEANAAYAKRAVDGGRFKPEFSAGHEGVDARIAQNLAAMGPTTSPEWRALIVFALVTVAWATQGLTGLDTTIVCLAGACLLFLPRFGVIDWNDANKGVSWQVLLVAGGGVSLGDILLKTGAANWLANTIFHALGLAGASALVVIVVVMLIVQFMHVMFVGTTAMATALLPIILALAGTAGVSPVALALPAGMIIGGYPLLMFYNTLPSILVYGTGKLRVEDFPKVGIVICLVACLVYAACAATWWRWFGLF